MCAARLANAIVPFVVRIILAPDSALQSDSTFARSTSAATLLGAAAKQPKKPRRNVRRSMDEPSHLFGYPHTSLIPRSAEHNPWRLLHTAFGPGHAKGSPDDTT